MSQIGMFEWFMDRNLFRAIRLYETYVITQTPSNDTTNFKFGSGSWRLSIVVRIRSTVTDEKVLISKLHPSNGRGWYISVIESTSQYKMVVTDDSGHTATYLSPINQVDFSDWDYLTVEVDQVANKIYMYNSGVEMSGGVGVDISSIVTFDVSGAEVLTMNRGGLGKWGITYLSISKAVYGSDYCLKEFQKEIWGYDRSRKDTNFHDWNFYYTLEDNNGANEWQWNILPVLWATGEPHSASYAMFWYATSRNFRYGYDLSYLPIDNPIYRGTNGDPIISLKTEKRRAVFSFVGIDETQKIALESMYCWRDHVRFWYELDSKNQGKCIEGMITQPLNMVEIVNNKWACEVHIEEI